MDIIASYNVETDQNGGGVVLSHTLFHGFFSCYVCLYRMGN